VGEGALKERIEIATDKGTGIQPRIDFEAGDLDLIDIGIDVIAYRVGRRAFDWKSWISL
jgi:hypothetical protein